MTPHLSLSLSSAHPLKEIKISQKEDHCSLAAVSCSLDAYRLDGVGLVSGMTGKLGHAWVVYGLVHGKCLVVVVVVMGSRIIRILLCLKYDLKPELGSGTTRQISISISIFFFTCGPNWTQVCSHEYTTSLFPLASICYSPNT